MKVSHWGGMDRQARQGRDFSDRIDRERRGPRGRPGSSGDLGKNVGSGSNSGYSSGGLDAPDGQGRDPFPPSLIAYIDVLRSVATYLRGGDLQGAAEALNEAKELIDSGEPTTFAFGEEDRGECGGPPDATTLAVGEEDGGGPIPVEPDNGIGDGAGPPEFTTLAIGEEDGGDTKPPDLATTLALGEEDGGGLPPDLATTLAVGEEDGGGIVTTPDAKPKPGDDLATTQALGEEDGGYDSRI